MCKGSHSADSAVGRRVRTDRRKEVQRAHGLREEAQGPNKSPAHQNRVLDEFADQSRLFEQFLIQALLQEIHLHPGRAPFLQSQIKNRFRNRLLPRGLPLQPIVLSQEYQT